jgi:hypothetical protein
MYDNTLKNVHFQKSRRYPQVIPPARPSQRSPSQIWRGGSTAKTIIL